MNRYSAHQLAEIFARFENENVEALSRFNIEEINIWPTLKIKIFFNYIFSDINEAVNAPADGIWNRMLNKITLLVLFWVQLLILIIQGLFIKNRVLFNVSNADKSLNDDNTYVNLLTDKFIYSGLIKEYIYASRSIRDKKKQDSLIKTAIHLPGLFAFPYQKVMRRKAKLNVLQKAVFLQDLLEKHFQTQGINMVISVDSVADIIYDFLKDYHAYKSLLSWLKPIFIITTEQFGTGFLAATKALNIPSIDFQHGLFTANDPTYQYDVQLKTVKVHMALPTFIGVFGKIHQEVLIKNGFWTEQEVLIAGSERVEINRTKFSEIKADRKQVLLPTQWTFFEETKILLKKFNEHPERRFKVLLKLHPTEPQIFADYYRLIGDEYKSWLALEDSNANIYKCISNSGVTIGFNSTTLLEAISLSRPAITMATQTLPKGIHDSLSVERLIAIIPCISLSNIDTIIAELNRIAEDDSYYQSLLEQITSFSDDLFSSKYDENAKEIAAICQFYK